MHHLVLINGYTHNGPWYEGDSYLSYEDPYALADCWRGYFNNEIIDVTSELWQNFSIHTRPYPTALHTERIDYIEPKQLVTQKADYEPILYCGFCNQYAKYREHNCDYDPPWDPFDGYPSGHDTD